MTSRQVWRRSAALIPKRPSAMASLSRAFPPASPVHKLALPNFNARLLTTSREAPQQAQRSEAATAVSSTTSVSTHDDVISQSRRSMLYVPGSSEKMIKKSSSSPADTIIFDLEDSVASHKKSAARETVFLALEAAARPGPELAVRINPPSEQRAFAEDDLDMILPSTQLQCIVVPKVESEEDISLIVEKAKAIRGGGEKSLALVLSIESANSLLRMPRIIEKVREQLGQEARTGISKTTGKPVAAVAEIVALLFASEDYCASTGIIRTRDRRSLLFPRAHMATIAKAYNLAAIDMVCIDYRDDAYLQDEAQEAKELGYDGKQAIHPVQVETIQQLFNPTQEAVDRAARVLWLYEKASEGVGGRGAYGLEEKGGGVTMIDRPMLLQAEAVVRKARKAGMHVPSNEELEATQS